MTPQEEEILSKLELVNQTKESRFQMATWILANPKRTGVLVEIAMEVKNVLSPKAFWILEYASRQHLRCLDPHIERFTQSLGEIQESSSVRNAAKICEALVLANSESGPNSGYNLSDIQMERISTACFDWLIGDYQVAPKAYAMACLFTLGKKINWIHPELELVLQKNYSDGSPAYKARARHIFDKLRKMEKKSGNY